MQLLKTKTTKTRKTKTKIKTNQSHIKTNCKLMPMPMPMPMPSLKNALPNRHMPPIPMPMPMPMPISVIHFQKKMCFATIVGRMGTWCMPAKIQSQATESLCSRTAKRGHPIWWSAAKIRSGLWNSFAESIPFTTKCICNDWLMKWPWTKSVVCKRKHLANYGLTFGGIIWIQDIKTRRPFHVTDSVC